MAMHKHELDESWVIQREALARVALPAGLYLHEIADADPASPVSLYALARLGQWITWDSRHNGSDLPTSVNSAWRNIAMPGDVEPPQDLDAARAWKVLSKPGDVEPAPADVKAAGTKLLSEGGTASFDYPVHLGEIALRVRVVKRLAHHAMAYVSGGDVREAWSGEKVPGAFGRVHSEHDAWRQFTNYMNAALRPFSARVYLPDGGMNFTDDGLEPTVYQVAVLQLFNDLADQATYRRCANATCGRLFIRQRDGRAQHYDRTQGVRYCSRSCANQQTQRDYRRRQRATQEGQS